MKAKLPTEITSCAECPFRDTITIDIVGLHRLTYVCILTGIEIRIVDTTEHPDFCPLTWEPR